MNISIQVNQSRLVKNLGSIFTNRSKVLCELMQNARRAGASRVEFDLDNDNVLKVQDDGSGIDDLSVLLHLAESGWDADLQHNESAFGMGFFAALFACEHVEVQSQGKRLSANCAELINGGCGRVEVDPSPLYLGTRITLKGFRHTFQNLIHFTGEVENLAVGFAIPVFVNGLECPRKHARDDLENRGYECIPFEFGEVFVKPSVWNASNVVGYLQGLRVYKVVQDTDTSIVHFHDHIPARMPDRDCLLDAHPVTLALSVTLVEHFRKRLNTLRASTDEKAFVEGYWPMIKSFAREITPELQYIGKGALERFTGYPCPSHAEYPDCLEKIQSVYSRDELQNLLLVDFDIFDFDESSDFRLPMYLRAIKAHFLNDRLPDNHWIQPLIRTLEDDEIELQVSDPQTGKHYIHDMVFCESVSLHSCFGSVEIEDGFVTHLEGKFVAVIPSTETRARFLCQCDSYMDEYDQFDQTGFDNDKNGIEDFMRRERASSPEEYLRCALSTLPDDVMQFLKGKSFCVAFTENLDVTQAK